MRLPVHAPDPGNGIATNMIRNTFPYCANFSVCLLRVLSNNTAKNRSKNFECFLRKFATGSRNFNIMKAGIRFPRVPIIKASVGERPILIPSGIPSLSSSQGTIELRNVVISGVVCSMGLFYLSPGISKG